MVQSTFQGHKVTSKPFNADELDCLKKHEHYKLKQESLRQKLQHEEEKKRSFRARPIPNFIVKVQERNWRKQQLLKLQRKKQKANEASSHHRGHSLPLEAECEMNNPHYNTESKLKEAAKCL